jgi:hypothetical protein
MCVIGHPIIPLRRCGQFLGPIMLQFQGADGTPQGSCRQARA